MQRLKLINATGDAVIALFGLLFLNWGIFFILLFYFIDLFFSETFIHIKIKKITSYQKVKLTFINYLLNFVFNFLLIILIITISLIAVYFIDSEIDFYKEFIAFLNYKEAGLPIEQVYVLFPIVFLGNFMQYKSMFINTKAFNRMSWKQLILKRRKSLLSMLAGGVAAILVALTFNLPGLFYAICIIGIKFYFDNQK